MDLKYKGVKVFVSETDEKISVTTDNLTLAKALKERKEPIEKIAEITGLSKEEIEKI